MAHEIIKRLPPHHGYVEPFAGGLNVLLRKPVERYEVANDADRGVFCTWKCVRERPDELYDMLAFTMYSRNEQAAASDIVKAGYTDDELLNAWAFLTMSQQALGCKTIATKQWCSNHIGHQGWRASQFSRIKDRIATVADRLGCVEFDNDDALNVIERHDSEGVLFYVDPPYCSDVATQGYAHSMSNDQQLDLSERLHSVSGLVVLSGYDCALYSELYDDWNCEQFVTSMHVGVNTSIGYSRKECL